MAVSHKKGQTIHGKAREVLRNFIKRCDKESRLGTIQHTLKQSNLRVAKYTGISVRSVTSIRKEGAEAGEYEDEDDEEILPADEAVEEPNLGVSTLLEGVEQLKLDLAQPPTEEPLSSDFDLFKDLQINPSDQLIPGLDLSPLSPNTADDLIGVN